MNGLFIAASFGKVSFRTCRSSSVARLGLGSWLAGMAFRILNGPKGWFGSLQTGRALSIFVFGAEFEFDVVSGVDHGFLEEIGHG